MDKTHLAFIRFHTFIHIYKRVCERLGVAGTPSTLLFQLARESVTLPYQWILVHNDLPRIVDPAILEKGFRRGRMLFERRWQGRRGLVVDGVVRMSTRFCLGLAG